MGLFGGKKNDGKESGSDRMDRASRSRRIVQPGVKGKTAPAEEAKPKDKGGVEDFDVEIVAKPSAKPQEEVPAKSATKSVSDPAAKPMPRPVSKMDLKPVTKIEPPAAKPEPKAPPKAATAAAVRPAPKPVPKPAPKPAPRPETAPRPVVDLEVGPVADDRPGRKSVSEAPPQELQFSGDLASAGGSGPHRSGDAALIDFLINKVNLINAAQAEEGRRRAYDEGLPIDVALTRLGHLSENDMVDALTQECWIPHLRIDKYPIRKKSLNTISREDVLRFSVLPVDKLGSILNLAMVNPLDEEAIQIIEQKTGLDIKKVVASRSEIDAGIIKYYGAADGSGVAGEEERTFSQDLEAPGVEVMKETLAKAVASSPPPEPKVVEVSEIDEDLVADIDDLLGGDEVRPAAVQPVAPAQMPAAPASPPKAAPTPAPAPKAAPAPAPAPKAAPAPVRPVARADDLNSTDDLFETPSPAKRETAAPAPAPVGGTPFDDEPKGAAAVEPLASFDLDDSAAEPVVSKSDVIDASDLFDDLITSDTDNEALPSVGTAAQEQSALESARARKPVQLAASATPVVDKHAASDLITELPSSATPVITPGPRTPPPAVPAKTTPTTPSKPLAPAAPVKPPAPPPAAPPKPVPPPAPPPVAPPKPAPPPAAPAKPVVPARPAPAAAPPPRTPVAPPKPSPTPAAPSTAPVGTAALRRAHTTARAATKSFRASEVFGKNDGIVTLVPVSEEHFQHAITHGRSNSFEKWISIQTRNRIINAVVVEDPVADAMADLFTGGYRITI
jgi:hypothetical protein